MDNLFVTKDNLDLAEVLHTIGDAICIADADMNILALNQRFSNLYGLPAEKMLGLNAFAIYPEFKSSVFYEAFQHTMKTGESATRVGYSNNLKKWIASRSAKYSENRYIAISHVLDTGFNQAGYVTNYDALTSLKNRFAFEKDLNNLTTSATPCGLTILDIKRFRFLNESFGLEFGDMCLMEAAARIKGTTPHFNQIYRINADQFAIITVQDKSACLLEVQKIISCFQTPFNINGEDFILDVAVGFYYSTMIGETTSDMINNAETALSEAKNSRNTYFEFTSSQNSSKGKMIIAKELKKAIKNGELELYYQAQVDTNNKKICGAEALIRWKHPEKGLTAPGYFLPVAEEYDLMEDIDKMVVINCFKDILYFASKNIQFPISINLSAQTICNVKTIDFFNMIIKRSGVIPSLVTIEITENSLMTNVETSKEVINHLKKCGFKIAIDDFGTGYSSISYIVRYPSDYLKIDRAFITNIDSDKSLQTIVNNITKMAHSLGISIVAEGVERIEEAKMLAGFDCDIIQGYLFGKPETKEQLVEKIKKQGISNLKSAID